MLWPGRFILVESVDTFQRLIRLIHQKAFKSVCTYAKTLEKSNAATQELLKHVTKARKNWPQIIGTQGPLFCTLDMRALCALWDATVCQKWKKCPKKLKTFLRLTGHCLMRLEPN